MKGITAQEKKEIFKSDGVIEENKVYLFEKPLSILVVGKKGKGKTNLIKHLILKNTLDNHYFHFGVVFTGTKYDKEYDFVEDNKIIQGWDEKIFQKYIHYLEEKKGEFGDKFPPHFIILDDLIGKIGESKTLLNFICCIRHFNCTLIMSTQYLRKATSTALRENIDLAFMFNTKFGLSVDGIYEAFGQLFYKVYHFRMVFREATKEPFTCLLYIDKEDEVKNAYKRYKAPDMTEYKVKLKF